jgi:hypothetical protein
MPCHALYGMACQVRPNDIIPWAQLNPWRVVEIVMDGFLKRTLVPRAATVTRQKYPRAPPSHLATHTTCLHIAHSVQKLVEIQDKSLTCHLLRDRRLLPSLTLVFQCGNWQMSLSAAFKPSKTPSKDGTYTKQCCICPILAGNQCSPFTRRSSFIKKLAPSPRLSMKTWLKLAPL